MHSPVWINYMPDLDLIDYDSDIDPSGDEYYDNTSTMLTRRRSGSEQPQRPSLKKRRKLEPIHQISDLSLESTPTVAQPVIWKPLSQRLHSPELPVVEDGEAKKVALMKDWRKQVDAIASIQTTLKAKLKPRKRPRKFSKNLLEAGAIDEKYALEEEGGEEEEEEEERMALPPVLPPLSIVQEPPSPKKRKHAPPTYPNGTSTIAKQAMQQASASVALNSPPQEEEEEEEAMIVKKTDIDAIKGAMEPKRRGRPRRDKHEARESKEKLNAGSNPRKKRKAGGSVEESPQKKLASGRSRKANEAANYESASTATSRMTRSKNK